jgi:hypothetical protein
MSRIVISPLTRWAGSVTLADPLNMAQGELIEAGMVRAEPDKDGTVRYTVMDKPQIPAIIACVEKWELKDFPEPGKSEKPTPENFPWSPRKDSHELIEWLYSEIRKIYLGELEVPNELEPTPTST